MQSAPISVTSLAEFSQEPDSAHVFKLCTQAQWLALQVSGVSAGSADDTRDGYIHLSTRAQVYGTYEKYFSTAHAAGIAVWLLRCELAQLPAESLRFEASRGGALFPHLYAQLPLTAVVEAFELRLESIQ